MQPAAIALGVRLRVLAESAAASAAQVVPDAEIGNHRDAAAVTAFAQACDVLTVTHGHGSVALFETLAAAGTVVRPSPATLVLAQDEVAMARRLGASRSDDEPVPMLLAGECPGAGRELTALVARSPSGQAVAWPVVETVRADGVCWETGEACREVIAPAPRIGPELAAQATSTALRVAGELGLAGVLAVGMVEATGRAGSDGASCLVVNNLVTGPHESGHWTIDGAVTSQFEQHLRAVLDLPLGDPRPRAPWTVTVSVPGGAYPDLYRSFLHVMARDPGVKVHLYGTAVEPGRVVGHVTVCGDGLDDVRARARHAADFITGLIDE
jgi:5-(carboxyamino)imidazole ribonucleotide synthase